MARSLSSHQSELDAHNARLDEWEAFALATGLDPNDWDGPDHEQQERDEAYAIDA